MDRFIRIICGACGVEFGMLESTNTTLKQSGATFYCPFGHKRYYPPGESEEQRLARELSRERQRLAERDYDLRRANEMAEHHKRRAAVYRGQVTKIKKRVSHGVCPCCNRSFENLARHMKSKHPDYEGAEIVDIDSGKVAQ